MPTFRLPSGRTVTDKASSISVVVTSSTEYATTSASGSSRSTGGKVSSGNPLPRGKWVAIKRPLCSASACGQAPSSRSTRSGGFCKLVAAASRAFHACEFLSGLVTSIIAESAIACGKRPAMISSAQAAISAACCCFFSCAASAAVRISGGAGR